MRRPCGWPAPASGSPRCRASGRVLGLFGSAPLASGRALPRAAAPRMGAAPNPGSTLQSIRRGQLTEIDYLNGAVVASGRARPRGAGQRRDRGAGARGRGDGAVPLPRRRRLSDPALRDGDCRGARRAAVGIRAAPIRSVGDRDGDGAGPQRRWDHEMRREPSRRQGRDSLRCQQMRASGPEDLEGVRPVLRGSLTQCDSADDMDILTGRGHLGCHVERTGFAPRRRGGRAPRQEADQQHDRRTRGERRQRTHVRT